MSLQFPEIVSTTSREKCKQLWQSEFHRMILSRALIKLSTDSKINVRITAFLYLPFYQEKIKPRQSSLQEEIYFNSYS